MSSLLIIGGTGFFGKSILDGFNRGLLGKWNIQKIIVMARNPGKLKSEAPELLSDKVELFSADIAKVDSLPDADYVIHAAASTDASKYLSQGEEERKNIISAALNYCRLAPIFHKNSKIVFCSSGAVYGQQPSGVGFLEENMDFGDAENLAENKKAYAYAKRDSEKAFQSLAVDNNMNVSVARCFAFVGKYLPRDQHFAIGNFIADTLKGQSIQVKAPHLVYRSYMYSDDLVEWLMTLCGSGNQNCPIYNVGSDISIELRDLANLLADISGREHISYVKTSDYIDRYVPSVDLAKHSLGVSLRTDLRTALSQILKNEIL
ncbi:NAD-dependent epimerase/dehydratase family protein [Hydrogenovibrio kuenenii]|uniref:NAD-dependent epimerase/dehydratase family protein n=1 Tax=Hydrogenovibrio kuenenii TaxID=63658 RepID=UPI000463F2E4|nr:NAD(P)-dependent oxidoreductase [Hydrogenovibrio kuenenii]